MRITIYLTEEEHERLRQLANANGTSASYMMRVALRKLLQLPAPAISPLDRLLADAEK